MLRWQWNVKKWSSPKRGSIFWLHVLFPQVLRVYQQLWFFGSSEIFETKNSCCFSEWRRWSGSNESSESSRLGRPGNPSRVDWPGKRSNKNTAKNPAVHMGVSKNSGTPKCIVYNGKPLLKWIIWGENPPFNKGNIHIPPKLAGPQKKVCWLSGKNSASRVSRKLFESRCFFLLDSKVAQGLMKRWFPFEKNRWFSWNSC